MILAQITFMRGSILYNKTLMKRGALFSFSWPFSTWLKEHKCLLQSASGSICLLQYGNAALVK